MKRIALLLTLSLTPQFIALAAPPTSSKVTDSKLIAARKQTAAALLPIALYEDSNYLAKLGDFENARKLASRMKTQKTYTMQAIAQFAAEDAIRSGDYPRAEREIKQAGNTALWVKLSKRYKQLNRTADARRTAFYAVAQARSSKDSYGWSDVAVWLCDLGEQAAARRLFAFAKKELLDTDPFLGSPMDKYYEAAAKCRFDDLIPKQVGIFAVISLVEIYASQNRDEMAYRIIENLFTEMRQQASQQPITEDKPQPATIEQAATLWQALTYMNVAFYQSQRGDRKASQHTLAKAEALLEVDNHHQDWLSTKFSLLTYCQYTANWKLADKIEVDIHTYLVETANKAPEDREWKLKQERLVQNRLNGFYVFDHPKVFSYQERQTAYARLKPLAIQYAVDFPANKALTYITLARAERSLNNNNWRTTLRVAEDVCLKNIKRKENWSLIRNIAADWRNNGEIEKARKLGKQLFDFWRQSSRSKLKPITKDQKSALDSERLTVVNILIASGLSNDALELIILHAESPKVRWADGLTELAKQSHSSPPQQVLRLPIPTRRIALRSWAEGLTPQPNAKENEGLNCGMPFLGRLF